MNTKIYVENLAPETTERELTELFSAFGNVADVNIAVEGVERKSRCFGCVTMMTPEGAWAAIQSLNGQTVGTTAIAVSEWRSSRRANSQNGRSPLRSSKLH